MRCINKGFIYSASMPEGWARFGAMLPTPLVLNDEVIRIYCAFADTDTEARIGRIGYVDVSAADPRKILGVSKKPVLDIGVPGAFDDNGVVPISLVRHDNLLYLYYTGFQIGHKVRFFLYGGLAVSSDNGETFTRHQQTPILERSENELLVRTAAFVLKDGGIWKMWYCAGSAWVDGKDKPLPTYVVKYLESKDGVNWGKEGTTCIPLGKDEIGFGRPFILKENNTYKMFYSIRTFSGYSLGYAESANGIEWTRKDKEFQLGLTGAAWDSQMQCYAAVCDYKENKYLFYNGNGFGVSGFGYAELAT